MGTILCIVARPGNVVRRFLRVDQDKCYRTEIRSTLQPYIGFSFGETVHVLHVVIDNGNRVVDTILTVDMPDVVDQILNGYGYIGNRSTLFRRGCNDDLRGNITHDKHSLKHCCIGSRFKDRIDFGGEPVHLLHVDQVELEVLQRLHNVHVLFGLGISRRNVDILITRRNNRQRLLEIERGVDHVVLLVVLYLVDVELQLCGIQVVIDLLDDIHFHFHADLDHREPSKGILMQDVHIGNASIFVLVGLTIDR